MSYIYTFCHLKIILDNIEDAKYDKKAVFQKYITFKILIIFLFQIYYAGANCVKKMIGQLPEPPQVRDRHIL